MLDTLVNLTERHLLLLASTTATHARNNHNETIPTITDVRMALEECGIISGEKSAGEEEWAETFRIPLEDIANEGFPGAGEKMRGEKRRRETEDLAGVERFEGWLDGKEYKELLRIAGMGQEEAKSSTAATAVVGKVGGEGVKVEGFLEQVMKRQARGGDADGRERLVGTVLGRPGEWEEGRKVIFDGGPEGMEEWQEKVREMARNRAVVTEEGEGHKVVVDAAAG